jgi:hypothetical protein
MAGGDNKGRRDSLTDVADIASSLYSCREPSTYRTGRTEAAACVTQRRDAAALGRAVSAVVDSW